MAEQTLVTARPHPAAFLLLPEVVMPLARGQRRTSWSLELVRCGLKGCEITNAKSSTGPGAAGVVRESQGPQSLSSTSFLWKPPLRHA